MSTEDNKPIIGITMGDYNGVGTEVILKALANKRILKICTPVIYGSMAVISKYRKILKLDSWYINQVNRVTQISFKKTNLVHCTKQKNPEIVPGKVSQQAGEFALESIEAATKDLKQGLIDAVITAPINKHTIQSPDFDFPGHTEYFTTQANITESLMMMVSPSMKVAVFTGHVPLAEISQHITRDKMFSKVALLQATLQKDFNIQKPKIAVLGLNPHAGEEGMLGNEEQQIIKPAVIEMKKKGNLVFGPYPADGFFGTHDYKKFDAVLAMYHDQGLIPFKTLAFADGVNYTCGLPFVRTSPDHGTAYKIAGKNLADETSFREAIFTACDVVKNRKLQMTDEA
ncbi:4-hydroxythreonine-4-phosphate dehydrogenase PdxA [uncultured Microscilla sp.]|uniref:4-hydroxythreonine-4-phosphate dehydrogenase PdxA n=1 Tax=uncultured Microscilla sp. TaxID=432653 RepID=UPI0026389DB8|nr:4-hydroxythreonine-4-phosphate dehydrogenase PdxA [uncultured Microscilla sp.]